MASRFNKRQDGLKRETPKVLTTTFIWKRLKGTLLIAVPKGNKVRNDTMDDPQ